MGYTAYAYNCENEVGQAIKELGVPRQDIWITTKLDNQWHHRVEKALEMSLTALDVEYLDLYLMHWPCPVDPEDADKILPNWHFTKTWYEWGFCHCLTKCLSISDELCRSAMQELPHDKVKNIGVANFDIHNLDILLRDPSIKTVPAVNQIELHPYNPSPKLVTHCEKLKIQCIGYSPLGSKDSSLPHEPLLSEISRENKRTPQQVLLMWGLQNGWGVIPGSFNSDHIKSNFDLDGWSLTENEIKRLANCENRLRVYSDIQRMRLPSRVFFDDEVNKINPIMLAQRTDPVANIKCSYRLLEFHFW